MHAVKPSDAIQEGCFPIICPIASQRLPEALRGDVLFPLKKLHIPFSNTLKRQTQPDPELRQGLRSFLRWYHLFLLSRTTL